MTLSEEKSGFPYFKQVGIGALSGLLALTLIILGLSISSGGSKQSASNTNTAQPSQSASASPSPTSSINRTCTVGALATDPLLGSMQAVVINADTNEVLFDRGADTASATASTMKVLTAGAALNTLGPNYRVSTSVYADPTDPSIIYLVGSGDPTLSRTSAGQQSVYKDAPKLSDLAIQIHSWATANNVTSISKIVLDSTLFTDPSWEPSWERTEQTQGYMSQVSALEVDGDRSNPQAETSPRSTDPVGNAGKYFKKALGSLASAAVVSQGKLAPNSATIATVQSQPISVWVKHMLLVSDNTEAEYLARLVALKLGFSGAFTSIDMAVKRSLQGTQLDFSTVHIVDGSGLSDNNQVAPSVLAKFLGLVNKGYGDFNVIKQGLPISNESGSLSDRFKGANIDAAGHILAKTGWIKHGYTLAGIINAKDGTTMTFAIYALGNVTDAAKGAIDNLATKFYRCGNNLSNQ